MTNPIEIKIKTEDQREKYCTNPVLKSSIIECNYRRWTYCPKDCRYSLMINKFERLVEGAGRGLETI